MANRTYLMNHGSDVPRYAGVAEDACMLGANYQIPILWVALFDQNDLTTVTVPCTDDAGDESLEEIPTLFASTSKAKATYASRRGALAAALGAESAPYIAEWENFVSSCLSAPSIQVDLGELWMMYDNTADCEIEIRAWLSGIHALSGPNWDSLCSQACFTDAEVRCYGLRGFPWVAELMWS